jgi:hypothetical protein
LQKYLLGPESIKKEKEEYAGHLSWHFKPLRMFKKKNHNIPEVIGNFLSVKYIPVTHECHESNMGRFFFLVEKTSCQKWHISHTNHVKECVNSFHNTSWTCDALNKQN